MSVHFVQENWPVGRPVRRPLVLALCLLAVTTQVSAQNWSFDARKVGMGSPGGGENVANGMIEAASDYRAFVLPFGLIQVMRDVKTLNPTNDAFDVTRGLEYAAPLHYTIGRDRNASGGAAFVVDVRNGRLSRDLNDYKGFLPINQPAAEGLASPNWGKTFTLSRGADGAFQGLYIGAGPYVSMRTAPVLDDRLSGIFSAPQRAGGIATPEPLTVA